MLLLQFLLQFLLLVVVVVVVLLLLLLLLTLFADYFNTATRETTWQCPSPLMMRARDAVFEAADGTPQPQRDAPHVDRFGEQVDQVSDSSDEEAKVEAAVEAQEEPQQVAGREQEVDSELLREKLQEMRRRSRKLSEQARADDADEEHTDSSEVATDNVSQTTSKASAAAGPAFARPPRALSMAASLAENPLAMKMAERRAKEEADELEAAEAASAVAAQQWHEATDEAGATYFYTSDGQTSWTKPDALQLATEENAERGAATI